MDMKKIYKSFVTIYKNPKYLLVSIAVSILYYLLLEYLIKFQNKGIFLLNVPMYLIYTLSIVSAVLVTISIYFMRNTIKSKSKHSGVSAGIITILFGGLINGCSCSAPILFSLVSIGISTSSVIILTTFISNTAIYLFLAMILVDIIIIVYYLNKLGNPSCLLKK